MNTMSRLNQVRVTNDESTNRHTAQRQKYLDMNQYRSAICPLKVLYCTGLRENTCQSLLILTRNSARLNYAHAAVTHD